MSNINKVANYLGKIPNGVTRPVKVQADDGKEYVMKFIHESCSSKILYNELIAYRLGMILEIPMPNCILAELEDDLINKIPELIEMQANSCTCFLSEYRAGTPNISPMIARSAINAPEISKILIFDQIILNNDRAKNVGNLYYDKKDKRVLAIDHSHIFINGEIWSSNGLDQLGTQCPLVVENLLGPNYRVFSSHLKGHSCYNEVRKTIIGLQKSDIENLFADIPADWNISKEDIKSSFELVWKQINEIDGVIIKLQNAYSKRKEGMIS